MKFLWILLLLQMFCLSTALSLEIGADSVVSVNYGENAGFGQAMFPQIVLSMPMGGGSSHGSVHVLSLGKAGDITLCFLDEIMVDGPGYDLAVFENPVIIDTFGNIYLELSFVEISAVGDSFIPYPYDVDTTILPVRNPERYHGLAGVWPVYSYNGVPYPLNPDSSGGDFFDLAEIGLENARFVRIIDTGDSIYDMGSDMPIAAGFDLDAIAAIHWTDATNPFMVTNAAAVSNTEILVCFSKHLATETGFPLEYFELDGIPLMSEDTVLVSDPTTLKLVLNTTPPLGDTMPILTVSQYIGSQTGENLLNRYSEQIEEVGISEVHVSQLNTPSITAYPNPAFNHVSFSINAGNKKTTAQLTIYDVAGRLVRTLPIANHPLSTIWDTRDESGKKVATGCYICKLTGGMGNAFCKILLFK